ncbi:TPA: hypothetical protein ACH3X1_003536 [Trebouxia sp. C0004]
MESGFYTPGTDLWSAPALAEAAAPPLELAFTPSLPTALAPVDEGTALERSCKELSSQVADFAA